MQENKKYDPYLKQYLKIYQENPRSKVFAPLAESYRKSNLVDEAIEICKEGLEYHPGFISGMVALARCYFDKQKYKEAIEQLETVVSEVPDNYLAQKLLSEAYYQIGDKDSSLKCYKMVLFLNPKDAEVAEKVLELENKNNKTVEEVNISENIFDDDVIPPAPINEFPQNFITHNVSETIGLAFEEKPVSEIFGIKDGEDDRVLVDLSTMTIGELLEEQGYKEKALSVYKKMLEKEPYNKKLIDKVSALEQKPKITANIEAIANIEAVANIETLTEKIEEETAKEEEEKEEKKQFIDEFISDEWIIPEIEMDGNLKLQKLNLLLKKVQQRLP